MESIEQLPSAVSLDTSPEQVFNDLCRLSAQCCAAPMAAIGFVDKDRLRLKARFGLDVQDMSAKGLCDEARLKGPACFEIADASGDPGLADHPLVSGPPHIRFVASIRLDTPDGIPLGAIFVFDTAPRPNGLESGQKESLNALARQVLAQAELQQAVAALAQSERRFAAFANALPQIAWSARQDGAQAYADYFNQHWMDYTGRAPAQTLGMGWLDAIHPEDAPLALERWTRAQQDGADYEVEHRICAKDGSYRWFIARAHASRDSKGQIERWFGTCTDIHELKESDEGRRLLARELSHRIKNIFTVIGGLAIISSQGKPEAKPFVGGFLDRINALALAHEYVRPHMSEAASPLREQTLLGLIETLIAPYEDDSVPRFALRGLDYPIGPHCATAMALILHEQATNAAKYGALSQDKGNIEISGNAEQNVFKLRWIESGGPEISGPPKTSGFGTLMAARSASGQLRGTLAHEWKSDGLCVTLQMPTEMLGV